MQPQRTRIEHLPQIDLPDALFRLTAGLGKHLADADSVRSAARLSRPCRISIKMPCCRLGTDRVPMLRQHHGRQQAVVQLREAAFQQRGRVAVGDADEDAAANQSHDDRRQDRRDRREHHDAHDGRRLEEPVGRQGDPKRHAQPRHGGRATFQPDILADATAQRPQQVSTAGASVGRLSGFTVDMNSSYSAVSRSRKRSPLTFYTCPFYASFNSRRISHSKQSRLHNAIIIQRSQSSSCWGSGAIGRMTVVV